MIELILLFFGSFGSVIILFLFYSGFFKPVRFLKSDKDRFHAVTASVRGDYKQIPQYQLDIVNQLQEQGISSQRSFAIYYDDPKTTPEEALRAECGVLVSEADIQKLETTHLKQITFPKTTTFHTAFEYKNGLSIMLAIIKIYPAFKRFAKALGIRSYATLELYDFSEKTLHFYFLMDNEASVTELYHFED